MSVNWWLGLDSIAGSSKVLISRGRTDPNFLSRWKIAYVEEGFRSYVKMHDRGDCGMGWRKEEPNSTGVWRNNEEEEIVDCCECYSFFTWRSVVSFHCKQTFSYPIPKVYSYAIAWFPNNQLKLFQWSKSNHNILNFVGAEDNSLVEGKIRNIRNARL